MLLLIDNPPAQPLAIIHELMGICYSPPPRKTFSKDQNKQKSFLCSILFNILSNILANAIRPGKKKQKA
jgi:hypothetical protein